MTTDIRKPRIVAFANHKGGVGKTVITCFSAAAAAEMGKRVLVIDMDPQANSTLLLRPEVGDYTIAEVIAVDEETQEVVPGALAAAIVPAGEGWPEGLDVVPGSINAASREMEAWDAREYRLARACEGALEDYDLVLLDLPPSLAQLTINSLVIADEVVVVTAPDLFGLHGINLLLNTIDRVRRYHNPQLTISSFVVNQYDKRGSEARSRNNEVEEKYGDLTYSPPAQRWYSIHTAVGAKHPLSAFGHSSRHATAWFAEFARTRLLEERATA
jgi:chromosome partitioning protein